MGHNSVVSGHPKSIGIPWVYGLLTGPSDLGRHSASHLGLTDPCLGPDGRGPVMEILVEQKSFTSFPCQKKTGSPSSFH